MLNTIMNDEDRSRLSELYPRVKTLEEIEQDDNERVERFKHRLPKHSALKAGVYAGIIYSLTVVFMQYVEAMWFSGGIALIFISFLLVIVLLGLGAWWVKFVQDTFYQFAKISAPFLLIAGAIAFLGIVIWITGVLTEPTWVLWPLVLGVVYSPAISALTAYALSHSEK